MASVGLHDFPRILEFRGHALVLKQLGDQLGSQGLARGEGPVPGPRASLAHEGRAFHQGFQTIQERIPQGPEEFRQP